MSSSERKHILCVAITDGNNTVSDSCPPHEHGDLIKKVQREEIDIDLEAAEYGFLTNEGEFVDRAKAKQIALAADQISSNAKGDDLISMMLIIHANS